MLAALSERAAGAGQHAPSVAYCMCEPEPVHSRVLMLAWGRALLGLGGGAASAGQHILHCMHRVQHVVTIALYI